MSVINIINSINVRVSAASSKIIGAFRCVVFRRGDFRRLAFCRAPLQRVQLRRPAHYRLVIYRPAPFLAFLALAALALLFTGCANKDELRANFYNEPQTTVSDESAGTTELHDEPLPAGHMPSINIYSSVTVIPFLASLSEEYKSLSGNTLDFVGVGKDSAIEGVLDNGCSAAIFASDGSDPGNGASESGAGDGGLESLVIAYEGIKLITNIDSGIDSLTRDEVVDLFTGAVSALGPLEVTLVVPKAGLPARDIFEEIYPVSGRVDGRWRSLIPDTAVTGKSEEEVVSIVESEPGAIGIVSLSADVPSVRTVKIDNAHPDSIDGYQAKREVVLLFDDGNRSNMSGLIAYLQSAASESLFVDNGLMPLSYSQNN
ncbi:MAG: substrate-binding domain-containing protein [Oscillospiraceae bacterium]|nr:substrate-binding domain-containing protein [Oscillospiraceae bacterium]